LCFPTAEAKFRFSLFFLYYFLRSFFFFLFLRSILPENINLDFLGKSTARWTQVWFPSQIFLQCFLRLIATVLFFLFLVSAHAVFSFLFCIFSRSRVLAFLISEWTDIYIILFIENRWLFLQLSAKSILFMKCEKWLKYIYLCDSYWILFWLLFFLLLSLPCFAEVCSWLLLHCLCDKLNWNYVWLNSVLKKLKMR
jgi:hypothetical protein